MLCAVELEAEVAGAEEDVALREAGNELLPMFGRLLREHRTRIGLTQRALADLSTVSVRAIRDLEQGRARQPRQDTVRLLADGLRLSRRARTELELAADNRRAAGILRPDYDPDLAAPPAELDALIGRESEIRMLVAELSGVRRLIDLVGLSGVGKTRLALTVANRLHVQQRMPVLWITAAPVGVPSVGDAGLAELARDCAMDLFAPPRSGTGAPTDLGELVADRPTLLVIDGVGMRPPCLDRIHRLLRDCPGLRVLITSTCPGNLPGARTITLAPLATATANSRCLADAAAVRLFLDHAEAASGVRPGVAEIPVVAEICRVLDGMPAALIAAASWLAVYGLDRLHATLRENPASLLEHLYAPGTHQGLSRCLRELPVAERNLVVLLAGLGEFTLDDVAAMTGEGLVQSGQALRALLEAGMIRARQIQGESVFEVLNLVRALLS